jgi:anti-sigma B factor antagonist
MSLLIAKKGGVVIAILGEQLDFNTSPEAEEILVAQIEAGESKIVMDFSKTEYISSAGLRVILKTAMILKGKGGDIALCNGNEQVCEVLEISGFMDIVNYYSSFEEAVTAISD